MVNAKLGRNGARSPLLNKMVAQYFCFSFFADGHDCPPIDDSCPAAALMSPESAPELTALQKITAQKGTTDRATVMAAHGDALLFVVAVLDNAVGERHYSCDPGEWPGTSLWLV